MKITRMKKKIVVTHVENQIIRQEEIFAGLEWKISWNDVNQLELTVYCTDQQFYNACVMIGRFKQLLHENGKL